MCIWSMNDGLYDDIKMKFMLPLTIELTYMYSVCVDGDQIRLEQLELLLS